jgi:hypothetical protein
VQPEPCGQIFGTVLHQQGHDFALDDARRTRPTRIAVGGFVEIAIGQRAVEIENGRRVGRRLGEVIDDVDDGDG